MGELEEKIPRRGCQGKYFGNGRKSKKVGFEKFRRNFNY